VEYLIEFANTGLVREAAEIAFTSPLLQGVVVDIDPWWLFAWHLRSLSPSTLRAWQDHFGDWISMAVNHPQTAYSWPEPAYDLLPRPVRFDDLEKWRPERWSEYTRRWGVEPSQLPFVIRLYLRPAASDEEEPPTFPEGFPIRIIQETRPLAMLYANPRLHRRPLVGGLSIGEGANAAGTLGGLVRDLAGNQFATTCCHVVASTSLAVDQPAQTDNAKTASWIGNSSAVSSLATNFAAVCNPWASGVTMNDVDVALVKIDKGVPSKKEVLDIGAITALTPRANLSPGQTVEFTGRSSGHKAVKIGGLAVAFRLYGNGQFYCFRNLFELRAKSRWSLLRGRPVRPGDSGAWVCNANSTGFGWCGMVIGGDRVSGYAVFSQNIEDWWKGQGLGLTV
jgi:hypothetical protein